MTKNLSKRLYVQNVAEWEENLCDGKFSDRKLEITVVEHGMVLPARLIDGVYKGGVCDNDFNFIAGYARFNPAKATWINVDSAYTVDRKDIVQIDEEVIFGGTLNGHFGHFMMENWCRLWYVVQHPELKLKVLFIITRYGYKSWFNDFFRLMGIDDDRIVYINKPTQCRSVIVPDQSQYWDNFTQEWLLPFQAIKSRVKPSAPKKLYLTRTKLENRPVHIHNEEYFENFFAQRGFEVVAMEKLTPEEQISLIMGADEIASVLGTLTHWALFCKPSAHFIMFPRTKQYDGHFQRYINNVFQNYHIVDVSKNFMYEHHDLGECLIGSTKYWKEFVADYFGEQIGEDDDAAYFEDALDKYIDFWHQKYAANKNVLVGSLKDMCIRIVSLEKEISCARPILKYQTHVTNKGWNKWWKDENQVSNSTNQKLDIQAIKIDFSTSFHNVYYAVYYNDKEGWSDEVTNSEMAGTTGKNKPIMGIKIRLDEAGASEFDIFYRVHKFNDEWTTWAKNGEELISTDFKLNAIQIRLDPKAKK